MFRRCVPIGILQPGENIAIQTLTVFSNRGACTALENIAITNNRHSCFQNLNVTMFSSDDDNVFKRRTMTMFSDAFENIAPQTNTRQRTHTNAHSRIDRCTCTFQVVQDGLDSNQPDPSIRSDSHPHHLLAFRRHCLVLAQSRP